MQSSCYFFTLFLIGQLVQLEAACTATGIPASGEVTWTESTVPNDHFKDCDNLIKFTFSNSNNPTRIGSGSFQSTSLKSIEIPESLVEIGDYAFNGVTTLDTLQFQGVSKLTILGKNSFEGTSIPVVTIPYGVVEIQPNTFKNSKLRTLNFYNDNDNDSQCQIIGSQS